MYADIIVDITHEKLDKVFQYRIPSHLEGMLKVGMEVVVPFGMGNKEIKGYVTGFSERAEYAPEKMKEVLKIAEESVAIESKLVALAAWMKESYGGTMIQALKTVLPIKKKEKAKEKQKVRLLLPEAEGKEKLELYLHKNQKARARLLAALLDQPEQDYDFLIHKLNLTRSVVRALEEQKENAGVQRLVKDLNALYRENKALYECDDQAKGFQWMNEISANECYVSFVRKGEEAEEMLLVVANFSGVPREITTGVPYEGKYKEILNTDAVCYGGTGVVNDRMKRAEDVEWDDKSTSVTVKLAPLSLSILQFIPYTEAELEKVIEKRIRKNTPIRKTTNKTAKKKQEK